MGYRPGAADPPFMGGGREGSETWSRCNIYYMLCMICVHIYVTICLGPLIYGCVEQMHGCVEQMHIISNYIYIYDDDGDGWIGWILDGEYACLSFFFGWVWGGSMVFG